MSTDGGTSFSDDGVVEQLTATGASSYSDHGGATQFANDGVVELLSATRQRLQRRSAWTSNDGSRRQRSVRW